MIDMPAGFPFKMILFAVLLIILVVVFVLPQASSIQDSAEQLNSAGALPQCCLELISPSLSADNPNSCERDVLNFQCSVSAKIAPSGKMSIRKVYATVNRIAEAKVSAEKVKKDCRCPQAN